MKIIFKTFWYSFIIFVTMHSVVLDDSIWLPFDFKQSCYPVNWSWMVSNINYEWKHYHLIKFIPCYINQYTTGNVWVQTQHCGYWCPVVKAPAQQYPQCWLDISGIRPVSGKMFYIYFKQHYETKLKLGNNALVILGLISCNYHGLLPSRILKLNILSNRAQKCHNSVIIVIKTAKKGNKWIMT